MHGLFSSRETIAAWESMPPFDVSMASAWSMNGRSAGVVSSATRILPAKSLS